MSNIAAGFWPCKVLDGAHLEDKGIAVVRINVEIADGPHKGQRFSYEEQIDNKQAPYIARTCKAVGWRCGTLATIGKDVADWVAETGGMSTVEIKHIEVKKGKGFEKWVAAGRQGPAPVWVKAGSIGRGPKPLKQTGNEALSDADEALRRALAEDGSGGGGHDDVPPPDDQDIPFITVSPVSDHDPICKVRTW